MSKCPYKFHLPYRLIHTFSSYISSKFRVYFYPYYNYLTEINFKSNLKNVCDIKMPSKKKKRVETQHRPIDAVREMMEDLNLQISDLTQIVKDQKEEIRSLTAKWNARESLEKEEKEKKERQAEQADSSWFWASRTSE